jgi:hypothetical protein
MFLRLSTLARLTGTVMFSVCVLAVQPSMAVDQYDAGGGPQSVFAADLDNTNGVDLIVANNNTDSNPDSVSILFNNGDGTFADPLQYRVRTAPSPSLPRIWMMATLTSQSPVWPSEPRDRTAYLFC